MSQGRQRSVSGTPHAPGHLPDETMELLQPRESEKGKEKEKDSDYQRQPSRTSGESTRAPEPAKPGANQETIDYILKTQQANESTMRSMRVDMRSMARKFDPIEAMAKQFDSFMNFQRTKYHIPEGAELNTPSDWRANAGREPPTDSVARDQMPPPPRPVNTRAEQSIAEQSTTGQRASSAWQPTYPDLPAPQLPHQSTEHQLAQRHPQYGGGARGGGVGGGGPGGPPGDNDDDDDGYGYPRRRQNNHNNPFNNHRYGREQTPGAFSSFTEGGTYKIKREDIGIFNPEWYDPDERGVVADGKNLIYTDVVSFTNRLRSLLENPATSYSNEQQVIALFDHLLAGAALLWWNDELPAVDRQAYRKAGLALLMTKLESRFMLRPGKAAMKFHEGRLTLRDIAADSNALPMFVQRKLRYARAQQSLDRDNNNWQGIMEGIRDQWDEEINDKIRRPNPNESLNQYMEEIEWNRHGLERKAQRKYPDVKPRLDFPYTSSQVQLVPAVAPNVSFTTKRLEWKDTSSRRNSDESRSGRSRSDDRNQRRSRDSSRNRDNDRNRDRDRDRKGESGRDSSRERSRDRNRDRGRDRDGDTKNRDKDKKKDDGRSINFADTEESIAAEAKDVHSSYYIVNSDTTCHKCHEKFESGATLRMHAKKCRSKPDLEKIKTPSPVDPARRTCGYCTHMCPSRNALFAHLRTCKQAKAGVVRKAEASLSTDLASKNKAESVNHVDAVPDEEVPIVKAPPTDKHVRALGSSYTYLKIPIRANPTAVDTEICVDPGTGRTMIGRELLNTFEHTIVKRDGKVTTVGDRQVALTEWATFKFYARGVNADGKPCIMEYEKEGWVVDDPLQPRMLIGNDFLHPHEAVINYQDSIITFKGLNGFTVTFEVLINSRECVRRVTNKQNVTLQGGESAYVQVDYKPLPDDRNFCFMAIHENTVNTLMDAKTPMVVPVLNISDAPVKINKGTKLGQIRENRDSGCHISSWKGAMKTLLFATAAALTVPIPKVVGSGSPVVANSLTPVNSEFKITPVITALATDTVPSVPTILTEMAKGPSPPTVTPTARDAPDIPVTLDPDPYLESNVPVSDAVYNMIVESGNFPSVERQVPTTNDPPKPRFTDQMTSGIKKPTDLPEKVTKEGIHVYSEKASESDVFVELVESYDVWVDKGEVDIPEDEQMKVPLVNNWQDAKLATRPYPLSRKDMELLNATHDKLHDKGRMTWVDEATPFAHPLFVVWRKVHGEDKGRVVVDLRALNKVAVPDAYPLPLQRDIIGSLLGKKYITVVDATGFFHQFKVHPDHRDRFTIVSPRGIERSNVALMGFRNSPAYVQRYMDRLFRSHSHYCRAFIDDIIIFSNTYDDHVKHLNTIFGLFQERNIAMSPKKSFIGYPSVELLGFRVDSLGMSTTAERVQAFKQLAFPNTLKALEQYLGASGFLRNLLPYYAQLAEPLQKRKTDLLAAGRREGRVVNGNPGKRKHYCQTTRYEPTPAEKASFCAVQDAICKETTIHHHNPDRILYFQIDGSIERGFGVMLFHTKKDYIWNPGSTIPSTQVEPVMYLSRCLSQAETRYGPSELEVACLVWAAKKLRTVIHSNKHPVVVLTDHSATKGIVDKTTLTTSATDRANTRLINSSAYLSQYGFQVYHLAGCLNYVPDALSRLKAIQDLDAEGKVKRSDEPAVLDTVWNVVEHTAEAVMDPKWREDFKAAYQKDSRYKKILDELCIDKCRSLVKEGNEDVTFFSKPGHPFVVSNGFIYNTHEGVKRLCVPHDMVQRVLEAVHDEKHHAGPNRMMEDLSSYSIYRKSWLVKKYVECCPGCDFNRTDRQKPVGNLRPIRPKDTLPMNTIAIDFILSLPPVKSEGTPWQLKATEEGKEYYAIYNCIMTVTCHTTKRTLLIPGNERYTAEEWATVLVRQLLLSDWGIPKGIISDRDKKFTSDLWVGIWKALKTKLLMTTAYHPQGDGLSERKNQTVELAIRFHNFTQPESNWMELLTILQWNLNSAFSEAMQSTPHEQLFGFKLPGLLDLLTSEDQPKWENTKVLRDHLRQDAKLAMDFAAAQAKRQFDRSHRSLEFSPGDKVLLRLHDGYHLPGEPPKKYSQQRAGPWVVKRRVGDLAYELDFPANYRIHPVISVAHLRPARSDEDPFQRTVPPPGPVEADQHSDDDVDEVYEVEIVLNHRPNRKKTGFDYLIKWKGWGHEHNVWKTAHQLRHSKDLIDEYWQRHVEKPLTKKAAKAAAGEAIANAGSGSDHMHTPPKRPRGRPRKRVTGDVDEGIGSVDTPPERPQMRMADVIPPANTETPTEATEGDADPVGASPIRKRLPRKAKGN